MLQINNLQREEFIKQQIEIFAKNMVLEIKRIFQGNVPETDEYLKFSLLNWIYNAESYGITYEKEVSRYLLLCYCCSELRLKTKPVWLENALRVREVSQNELLNFLEYKLLNEEITEIYEGNKINDIFFESIV